MENWKPRTSNGATGALRCEYDVFLNFRGEDTRHNFTDFLYDRLVDAGVHTFRDEEKLPVGDVICEGLEQAISNSTLYISIFSPTYASSKWCLRELKVIIDNVSKLEGQKSILPIFFLVKPDHVKLKTAPDGDAPYEAAFLEHEKKFPDEVEAWKAALRRVDEHKGWVVDKNTSQATIIRLVVGEVLEKLKIKQKSVTENLVGFDDRVKDLTELLDIGYPDVRLVGIYGMGGIGKTTIAKIVFNQLCSHFGKYCSFIEDVRESSSTKVGIVQLQKRLLSDIGGSRSVGEFNDSEEGIGRVEAALCTKKVLVVLDDVVKKVPIKSLIGNSKFYQGSRIIITTRDRDILQVEGSDIKIEQYEMQTMDDGHALQLFCRHAFRKNHPLNDYYDLSRKIVSLIGGLPLAIEVVGSLLKDKEDKKVWEDTLVKLRKAPKKEIIETLRISYNDLDEFQKKIFLDIACFFYNEKKTDAIYMWESCNFYPAEGIEVLIKRCLIKILDHDMLWMHDQLIAFGRQIVREDSRGDLRKQSRLWDAKEALQILKTEKWKHEVQGLEIFRCYPEVQTVSEIVDWDPSIVITNEDFERLPNLRFLKLRNGTFGGDFASCCSDLRWFSWHSPFDFKADNLYLDRLVVCKLEGIALKDDSEAWHLIQRAQNLKVLSIIQCLGITTIPDISRCLVLERLTIEGCRLKRIGSFIGNLHSLIELKIEGCGDLPDLPEEIGALVKLKHLSLAGCYSLTELPGSIGKLTSLMELDLSDTGIRRLPNFIGKLESLHSLHFLGPSSIGSWQLPNGISTLVNLKELDLSGHNEMKGEIPLEIRELSSLRILNLESTGICRIPRTINMLHHLQTLNLSYCHEIQELPELPTSLTRLYLNSKSLLFVPDLSNLNNLVELQLSDDSYWRGRSNLITGCNLRWIVKLSRLKKLELNLLDVPAPPELASLSHLEELVLRYLDLKPLMQLPSSDWSLKNLLALEFYGCEVEDIPLDGIPWLEKLRVECCEQLQRLSIPSELSKLRQVDVSWCQELIEIQVVGLLESLKYLSVINCDSLTRISGLSYLKNMEKLAINMCRVLIDVEGLNELEDLKFLEVTNCMSLRRLIDASCTKIPVNCEVTILWCGEPISRWQKLVKQEETVLNASNQDDALSSTRGTASHLVAALNSRSNRDSSSRKSCDFRKRFIRF